MSLEETITAAVAAELRPILEELRALRAELQRCRQPAHTGALLTVEEVGERCGKATAETVRSWIHDKKLIARKAGNRYLVAPEDLERFLALEPAKKLVLVDADKQMANVMERVNRGGGSR